MIIRIDFHVYFAFYEYFSINLFGYTGTLAISQFFALAVVH